MKLKTTLLAAAAMVAIAPAAQAYEGLYGAIGAGLSYMEPDRDVSNNGPDGMGPFAFDSSADFDRGMGIYTALGYDWGNSLRTELEFAYRNNDIRHLTPDQAGFSGWQDGTIAGDVKSRSIMLNFLYDFDYNSDSGITPYIGGGLGFASIDPSILGSTTTGAPGPNPMTIAYGNSQTLFAYQGIAGMAIQLAERFALDLSYRYFATKKGNYTGTLNGAAAAFDAGYNNHSLMAGLRWNFAAPPAPPVQYKDCWDGSSVPMTSSCPPELVEDTDADLDDLDLIVYFDYDKSNLTSQASELIREAASQALANDIETVVVAGNTDTSGSSAYNQALSERRARVVRDALIANGVPADRIVTQAYGEGNLAKPTPDGTREPLNRRTNVTISFL